MSLDGAHFNVVSLGMNMNTRESNILYELSRAAS